MSKPNRNDISIGKDKWITFVEPDGQQTRAIELDEILNPIEPFLNSLETECVAELMHTHYGRKTLQVLRNNQTFLTCRGRLKLHDNKSLIRAVIHSSATA